MPFAKAPTMPAYVWARLKIFHRMADSGMQKTQNAACAPLIPLLRAIESVNVRGDVDKKLVFIAFVSCIGHDGRYIP